MKKKIMNDDDDDDDDAAAAAADDYYDEPSKMCTRQQHTYIARTPKHTVHYTTE